MRIIAYPPHSASRPSEPRLNHHSRRYPYLAFSTPLLLCYTHVSLLLFFSPPPTYAQLSFVPVCIVIYHFLVIEPVHFYAVTSKSLEHDLISRRAHLSLVSNIYRLSLPSAHPPPYSLSSSPSISLVALRLWLSP